ncbi:MAG: hypothetical protein SNI45_06640 [Rikenellaceae bacterium]
MNKRGFALIAILLQTTAVFCKGEAKSNGVWEEQTPYSVSLSVGFIPIMFGSKTFGFDLYCAAV